MSVDAGHRSQDAFDLRDEITMQGNHQEDSLLYESQDEDRSVLVDEEDEEDDASSTLSIPNESIDFDLVYSFHTFVATVEGQANVMKGDSLFLMDDSNSYWWLVRVLRTGQIGYIPAENIETPFERLARLNKHRNVDLAAATPAEQQEDTRHSRERVRNALTARSQNMEHHSPTSSHKSVIFTGSSVYYYPPFVWGDPSRAVGEEGDEPWDEDEFGSEGSGVGVEEVMEMINGMEPDDGMSWEEDAVVHGQMDQAEAIHLGITDGSTHTSVSGLHVDDFEPSIDAPSHPSLDTHPSSLRTQSSREKLMHQLSPSPAPSLREMLDPAEISETKKVTVTPSIAREDDLAPAPHIASNAVQRSFSLSSVASGVSSQESASSKRQREDNADLDSSDSRRPRSKGADKKLRKDRSVSGDSRDSQDSGEPTSPSVEKEKKEKKKGGFMSLFSSKKKDKKDKDVKRSAAEKEAPGRSSTDSISAENGEDPLRQELSSSSASRRTESPISIHTARLQQKDQEQQQLYQQHLRKSPSNNPDESYVPEPQPSLSHGAPSIVSGNQPSQGALLSPGQRTSRPGSLILTGATLEGSSVVPTLSVLRIFAGGNLQSDATFKTVLVNASTTSAELVRQGMQRFRLPHGENPDDYYLSIKQLEGDEALLEPNEHPLLAFEQLVERALSIPTVKRSSVGSISSVASNLSMHPAIAKLEMNDFTDDSAVKLYLHRRVNSVQDLGQSSGRDVDSNNTSIQALIDNNVGSGSKHRLSITISDGLGAVSPERFNSPSARFSLQVVIYPEDLPDGMVFDPHTEAIVPKSSLQQRSSSSSGPSPGVPQTHRKKIFAFPKNTTVAEVIEASLERFGIVEGVVEGGDDVEDKPVKRRSSSRVRYGLSVAYSDLQQRELQPSSKVLDAFLQPPAFRYVDRRSAELRRRSGDAIQILGTQDDVQRGDPTFILRKSSGIKSGGNARFRGSNHLDEIALHQRYRDSTESSQLHGASNRRDSELVVSQTDGLLVRQNVDRGLDIIIRGKGVVKSARHGGFVRYGFIPPTGDYHDIHSMVVEEWKTLVNNISGYPQLSPNDDILDALVRKPPPVLQEFLEKAMNGVRHDTLLAAPPLSLRGDASPSIYSESGTPATSPIHGEHEMLTSRSASLGQATHSVSAHLNSIVEPKGGTSSGAGPASPRYGTAGGRRRDIRQSMGSMDSDISQYTSNSDTKEISTKGKASAPTHQEDVGRHDSGLSRMLAMIELGADLSRPPSPLPITMVDRHFLGIPLASDMLHPVARNFFETSFRRVEEADKRLDSLLRMAQAIDS
ncbi:uncharacterized protein EI90DRAFT_392664 [Cantharellus anzutake]|uniref:uncharacterized protein n=1 Tax=Cantharellus anzutake TaxID=1750568 RepID=UPI00190312DE|nr:uncharacterized protein EI90DRAFT_392664 [Cantharellus anzutake]KAF8335029.1 hypothetical protein EI90DRAFT_392664 [Cantharellus anzutake]